MGKLPVEDFKFFGGIVMTYYFTRRSDEKEFENKIQMLKTFDVEKK